jgi:hypothetical protein
MFVRERGFMTDWERVNFVALHLTIEWADLSHHISKRVRLHVRKTPCR